MAKIFETIAGTIGRTPLVKLGRSACGVQATILVKCEFFNPLGSVKDRIGLAMVEDAEKRGVLKPGTVIIEPTSGNTGIALAFVATVKGYQLILTMPETMSRERRTLLALLGARLELTPGEKGMKGAIEKADELKAKVPEAWIPQQFQNPVNIEIHRKTTAEEIWKDTGGGIDILVAGVGTGGTFTGVSETLRPRRPGFRAVAVEPDDSPVITRTRQGRPLEPGPHKIQGIGAGFVPKNLHLDQVDDVVQVSSETAFEMARHLSREEGIPAGISSGANVAAALEIAARPENRGKTIVTFAPSSSERYLSTPLTEGLSAF